MWKKLGSILLLLWHPIDIALSQLEHAEFVVNHLPWLARLMESVRQLFEVPDWVVSRAIPIIGLMFLFWLFWPDVRQRFPRLRSVRPTPDAQHDDAKRKAIAPPTKTISPERRLRKYYSLPEAASIANVSEETLYQLAMTGEIVLSIVEPKPQDYEIQTEGTDDNGQPIRITRKTVTAFSTGQDSPSLDLWYIRPEDAKKVIRNPAGSVALINRIYRDRGFGPKTGKGFLNSYLRITKADLLLSSDELDRFVARSYPTTTITKQTDATAPKSVAPQGRPRQTAVFFDDSKATGDAIPTESFENRECVACKYADFGLRGRSTNPECLRSRNEVLGKWNTCTDTRANRDLCANGTWFEPRDDA